MAASSLMVTVNDPIKVNGVGMRYPSNVHVEYSTCIIIFTACPVLYDTLFFLYKGNLG